MPEIKPGHIIQGPRWPEPVELKLVEDLGDYIHLVGATTGSGEHVDQLIPRQELAQLQIARVENDFGAPPHEVFLGLEARRYRFASLYDPLLAMNTSKVDPLPHQIEPVYGYVRRLARLEDVEAAVPEALSHGSFFFADIEQNQVDEAGLALLQAGESPTVALSSPRRGK